MPSGIYVRTDATKQRLREVALNRPPPSEATCEKWRVNATGENNPMYGIRLTGEKNHSFGKPLSETTRKKIGDSLRGKKRKPFSEETCRKMREAAKLRPPRSEDHKKHISESKKGKPIRFSEESIERKRLATIARNKLPMSDATRKKMSDAKKGIAPLHSASIKGVIKLKELWRDPEYRKEHCELRIGSNNSNWKGGISFEPYCPKFTPEFRERVRAFFNYTCQCCGHVWKPEEARLSVHHVNYNKATCCNNEIPLFVPVCAFTCHGRTNAHRQFWESWFTEIINEFYDGKCYYSKEEMQSINMIRNKTSTHRGEGNK